MFKKVTCLILSLALVGCQSNSKETKYNNMAANDIYQQGVKNARKGYFSVAVEDFEALEARYPFGKYADNAQLGAIYAMYKADDYPAALPAVERFIRMYPRHPHVDYAHYMQGLIQFSDAVGNVSRYLPVKHAERDTTAAKKALSSFNTLVQQFPNSTYSKDAQKRMVFLRNMIANNELAAARFYFAKKAYQAAANRANYVVVHFDQTLAMPEALSIMAQSYEALKMNQLAAETKGLLIANYPESEFAADIS